MERKIRIIDVCFILLIIAAVGAAIFNVDTRNIKDITMEQIMNGIETFFAILISGGTIGWAVWKYYLLPKSKKIKAEKELIDSMVKYLPVLKNIAAEFKPNGGSTFKDGLMRIEQTLFDIQESQRAFFDVQELAYWVSDENGHCIYSSKALCEITGRTSDEIKGNNWAAWLHPKDKQVFDTWNDSVANNIIFNLDYTYKRSDGMWQDVNGYAVHKQKDSKYIGSVGRLKKLGEPYR